MSRFGQLVIGPPGSGKSTYCQTMSSFYKDNRNKRPILVNLDPANENSIEVEVDITKWITVRKFMKEQSLGPNGALMYCLDYFYNHYIEEFSTMILDIIHESTIPCYFLFDCPGQVELFIHDTSIIKKIIHVLTQQLDFRLVTIHLVDSNLCHDIRQFISIICLSLSCMLQFEHLPHINVLSKMDLLDPEQLIFPLSFYKRVSGLEHIVEYLKHDSSKESPYKLNKNYDKLNMALVNLIDDYYGLVSFQLFSIHDMKSIVNLSKLADNANGWIYGTSNINESILTSTTLNVDHDVDD